MRNIYKSVVFLGALALALGTGARAQLVNGSFEGGPGPGASWTYGNGSTGITGWTVLTNSSGQVSWDGTGAYGIVSGAGVDYLDITGNNDMTVGEYTPGSQSYYTTGAVSQTFGTTAGDTYAVSYLLGTDSYYNSNSTPGIEAFVSGTAPSSYSSLDLANPTSETSIGGARPASRGVWTDEGFDFVATGSSSSLTFVGYSELPIVENEYVGLDDVSLTNEGNLSNGVPDTASTLALLAVGAFGLLALGRRAGLAQG